MNSIENDRKIKFEDKNPFESEIALYEKMRKTGDINVLVCVPDFYHIALPNIGHQIIEHSINQISGFYASRGYLNSDFSILREDNFTPEIVIISMSYEGSYIRAIRILDLLGIPLYEKDRSKSDPVVIFGGRAVSMNPIPLFKIADIIGVGDSTHLIESICFSYKLTSGNREFFYDNIVYTTGVIVPSRYHVETTDGYLTQWKSIKAPLEIYPNRSRVFPHSWYLSPNTDYNDIGYYEGKTFFSIEIVKACKSSCFFCAEGFNNGNMRFTSEPEQIIELSKWAKLKGANLIKLFFPANSTIETTKKVVSSLIELGIYPRVGSAKAERIDDEYIRLVGLSGQEKMAIAPETGDEILRARIGKPGMTNKLLYEITRKIILASIPNLDFYFIANLPIEGKNSFFETSTFLESFIDFTKKEGLPGRFRISMPNFFPKAWTPFQYASSGRIQDYLEKINSLEEKFTNRLKISSMKDNVDLLSQNIMSRGGIEVGDLLIDVFKKLKKRELETNTYVPDSFNEWLDSINSFNLQTEQYFSEKSVNKKLPWDHIHLYDSKKRLANAWLVYKNKRRHDLTLNN